MLHMEISVIVPVFNEADSIRPLLDSLLNQTLKPAEIVITDGGSTDSTVQTIDDYIRTGASIKLIRTTGALPGRGRNLAAAAANFAWLAFIDAGVRPEKNWLERLARRAQQDRTVDVVYGFWSPVTDTFFKECAAIGYVPPPANQQGVISRPRSIASTLMRREAWQTVGGFPEDLRSAEDLLFMEQVERAGFRAVFEPRAVVHWSLQPTLARTFKRFVTYSCNNIQAGLWRQWQAAIFRRYGLLLLCGIPAFFLGWWWLLVVGALWLLMLATRAAIALRRNRQCYPAGLLRTLLRLLMLLPLIATLDAAAIVGSAKWLLKYRLKLASETADAGDKA